MSKSRFLNLYRTDTTQSRTQDSSICIVQIQLNLELKIPQFVSYRYNSMSKSRFLNLYRTDITQCQSQDSSTCIVQIKLNVKVKVLISIPFKIELKLTLCFLLESETKHLVKLTYILLLLNY